MVNWGVWGWLNKVLVVLVLISINSCLGDTARWGFSWRRRFSRLRKKKPEERWKEREIQLKLLVQTLTGAPIGVWRCKFLRWEFIKENKKVRKQDKIAFLVEFLFSYFLLKIPTSVFSWKLWLTDRPTDRQTDRHREVTLPIHERAHL